MHGLRRGCEVQPADYFDPLTHGLYELGSVLGELGRYTEAEATYGHTASIHTARA